MLLMMKPMKKMTETQVITMPAIVTQTLGNLNVLIFYG